MCYKVEVFVPNFMGLKTVLNCCQSTFFGFFDNNLKPIENETI